MIKSHDEGPCMALPIAFPERTHSRAACARPSAANAPRADLAATESRSARTGAELTQARLKCHCNVQECGVPSSASGGQRPHHIGASGRPRRRPTARLQWYCSQQRCWRCAPSRSSRTALRPRVAAVVAAPVQRGALNTRTLDAAMKQDLTFLHMWRCASATSTTTKRETETSAPLTAPRMVLPAVRSTATSGAPRA